METGDKTVEQLDMVVVQKGNCTHAANDIIWCVSQIECLCMWHVLNYYPVIMNCRHRIFVSLIDLQVEPYSLSLVEILSSTCSVINDSGKLL